METRCRVDSVDQDEAKSGRRVVAYINNLESKGRFAFGINDSCQALDLRPLCLRRALKRLAKTGRLNLQRGGFCLLMQNGSPPSPESYIHDLMKHLGREERYYVGLLAAASLHGATAFDPTLVHVVTDRPRRPISIGTHRILFVTKGTLRLTPTVIQTFSQHGTRFSTPEATALDLVRFHRSVGGFQRVTKVLSLIEPKLRSKTLCDAAKLEGNVANARRLGCLLEYGINSLVARELFAWFSSDRVRQGTFIPLEWGKPMRGPHTRFAPRWMVKINVPLSFAKAGVELKASEKFPERAPQDKKSHNPFKRKTDGVDLNAIGLPLGTIIELPWPFNSEKKHTWVVGGRKYRTANSKRIRLQDLERQWHKQNT